MRRTFPRYTTKDGRKTSTYSFLKVIILTTNKLVLMPPITNTDKNSLIVGNSNSFCIYEMHVTAITILKRLKQTLANQHVSQLSQ